jgi:uncharacterized SAM-binding protein YcdF (DUF218 family)
VIDSARWLLKVLVLPPVPFLLVLVAGLVLLMRGRRLALVLVVPATLALWLMTTPAGGKLLLDILLDPPPPLSAAAVSDLRGKPDAAIVILGGGRRPLVPEYHGADLVPRSIERLRYGLWLARATGLPVAFSGGIGHGGEPGLSEAEIAALTAEREFGQPLRWTETASRDTRENAVNTVALLGRAGVRQIVLVTHAAHIPRALRNFRRASESAQAGIAIVAAPMGGPTTRDLHASDWISSPGGYDLCWSVFYEWLGLLAGA